jgi:hypothetical protein
MTHPPLPSPDQTVLPSPYTTSAPAEVFPNPARNPTPQGVRRPRKQALTPAPPRADRQRLAGPASARISSARAPSAVSIGGISQTYLQCGDEGRSIAPRDAVMLSLPTGEVPGDVCVCVGALVIWGAWIPHFFFLLICVCIAILPIFFYGFEA